MARAARDPFRLNPVEPGAFGGQPAGNDAHACFAGLSFLQHGPIVLAQPGFNLLAHMKGGHYPKSARARVCPALETACTATLENQ